MIIWAFNLLILAVGILIIGLIKPNWFLFWMDQEAPRRLIIIIFSSVIFMVAAVLYGEGNRKNEPLSEVVQTDKPVVLEVPSDLVPPEK